MKLGNLQMKNTMKLMLPLALLTLTGWSAGASANDSSDPDRAYCGCDYRRPNCAIPLHQLEQFKEVAPEKTVVAPLAATPIYVGGVRYSVNQASMTPFYRTRVIPGRCPDYEPIYVEQFAGYRATIAVDGDSGQNLFFDIVGRASADMTLKVSCGSFTATDSGNKFVISTRQSTGGTCREMQVELTSSASTPTVDLSIMISEQL